MDYFFLKNKENIAVRFVKKFQQQIFNKSKTTLKWQTKQFIFSTRSNSKFNEKQSIIYYTAI